MQELIKQLTEKITSQKELILKEKCKILGVPIPDLSLKDSRFNPYILEKHEGFGELYYYNDGTKNGKFIVGFSDFEDPDYFNEDFKINFTFKIIEEEPEWNKK